jgi:AraC family transcriptional regulator
MTENKFLENEYIARINRVIDHVESNLEKSFTLDELADIACFSKYHFHRIFTAILKEPPFQFVKRIRIEKSAVYLSMNPKDSIGEIAFRCGFSDISVFSRNFKDYFGMSPSVWRKEKQANSNHGQTSGKIRQVSDGGEMYFCFFSNTIKWRTDMELNKSVEVKTLDEMNLAYIRHIGPYQGDVKLFEGLWNKMFAWAGPRGLIGGPDFKSLIIYHDDPNVTAPEKLRTDICITVPDGTAIDGEVVTSKINPGQCAVGRFVVSGEEFAKAWEWMYGSWLPNSGYQPDGACFEVYPEEPKDGKFTVDICIPVKPL